ncbi:MAG: polysaccharide biosynthesis/export family protein [Candidatus Omnitrophica bacterium]|nr:polysaccharide biosynthesis/export family protein [Candidatus Omnitrophota bacterium]
MKLVYNKTIVFILLLILFFNLLTITFAQDNNHKEKAKEHYLRGNIYYQQGKYKEAQEEFQKALEILSQKQELQQELQAEVVVEKIAPEQRGVAKPPEPTRPQLEYVLGEEDILRISVWQNPDLDQEVIVRPDGKVSFPLIGDVVAVGLTITELDQQITERLKEYIRSPEVSISLKKLGGKKVIVLGEVARPGVYSVTGARTVLEAVGLAGGFTKDAVASSVILIRGGFQSPQAQRLNLTKALVGDTRQNIPLQSEDIIFIPKKFIANINYFLSQVLDPLSKGAYTTRELQRY